MTRVEQLRSKVATGEYRIEDRELADTLVTRWLEERAARTGEHPTPRPTSRPSAPWARTA